MLKTDEKIFLQKFGKRVRELRKQQNLTQAQLAFELDTSESQIRRIEKGEISLGLVILKKLADTLDISFADLFDF